MANEIQPVKSHLFLYDESTWGTTPNSPTYVHVPVYGYGVQLRKEVRAARPFLGLRQQKHTQGWRATVSGQLQTALYGYVASAISMSLAQYLLTWALGSGGSTEAVALASKGGEWAVGPDVANQRHTGLRVNSWTLEGSADSGMWTLSLDLIGKDDAAITSAQTIPTDMERCVEFEWADTTFTLGGSSTEVRKITLQGNNNLKGEFVGGRRISHLLAGDREVTMAIELAHNNTTYDVYRRASTDAEQTAVITMKGLHNGTGTVDTNYTIATLTATRCQYVGHDDQRGRDGIEFLPLQYRVLKPDSSTQDLVLAMSEGA